MTAIPDPNLQGVDFYLHVLNLLDQSKIPYLLGGAFATGTYTGVVRDTKDLDCMIRRRDVDAALAMFAEHGFRGDYPFPHWLAKVYHGEYFVDLIYSSGNSLCPVDDEWFAHSRRAMVLGREVSICPAEEIMWQKAYIMERERFDGGDVIHLIRGCGLNLDWERLLRRFGDDWRVLFCHTLMHGYVYPAERDKVPAWVLQHFAQRVAAETEPVHTSEKLCKGPFISRAQYLPDLEHWGYPDLRLGGAYPMKPDELALWTAGIDPHQRPM